MRNLAAKLLLGAVFVLLALVAVAPAADPIKPIDSVQISCSILVPPDAFLAADAKPAADAKTIDVVICLDTSNSMDGLIASAKTKLWAIVNDLAKAQPTPNLRVGLYSYGNDNYDRTKGWVRKEVDLTTDLDTISDKLFGLTTRGGTEYVARVTRDSVEQLKWSDDKGALKLIFVCGNEPASQDKEVTLKSVAELATGKGIIINPIYAGRENDPAARDWKEFAVMSGGRFANIDQDGTVAIATPMDKELTELSAKLNDTYVAYGALGRDKAANQLRQDVNAAKQPGAAPDRAMSKAGGLYRNSDWDLVDLLEHDPKFDLTKIPEDQLPEAMKKLKPEERLTYVKDMAAKRKDIQKQVADLGVKREAFIRDEMKKKAGQAGQALDDALRATLREQAATKGIKIPE